jgi:uncharacterized protein (DUF1778 family)
MIRQRAEVQRRGISGYMLNIVMRAADFQERMMARGITMRMLSRTAIRIPGPRTAILLRCSTEESERIHRVAKARDTTISGFVLDSLRRSWDVERNLFPPQVRDERLPTA